MEDAKSIIEAVERLATPDFAGAENNTAELALAFVPAGKKIENLQPYIDALRDRPRRIETTARLTRVESLIGYVNRFKLADSAIFADDDPAKPSLFAVIDFHGGTDGEKDDRLDETPGSAATPRFGLHCARYDFPVSEQIAAWSAISGRPLSHAEMAGFIDERQYDICNPPLDWMQVEPATLELMCHLLNLAADQGEVDDEAADGEPDPDGDDRYVPRSALYKLRRIRFGSAARLLQMARTVELSVSAKASEGYAPKTGERTVTFAEEHETRDGKGRKIIVPDAFLLRVPVFEGETPQLVPVRLQYRHKGGAFSWFLSLVEWRRVVRFAVREEAEKVCAATGLPLFYGARAS